MFEDWLVFLAAKRRSAVAWCRVCDTLGKPLANDEWSVAS